VTEAGVLARGVDHGEDTRGGSGSKVNIDAISMRCVQMAEVLYYKGLNGTQMNGFTQENSAAVARMYDAVTKAMNLYVQR
jgi:hypothetical protein